MEHHNHHHHTHEQPLKSLNNAFIIGIALNLAFVVAEFTAGSFTNSIGLKSDALHNLGDVASLFLAMIAFKLTKSNANRKYTYGYQKTTILVSLTNAVILLVAVGMIVKESIEKFLNPAKIDGDVVAWVAGVGVLINAFTAYLFVRDKDKDLNIKGAYLHMAADALVSVGVVIVGIVVYFTNWYFIDPIIGLTIAGVIVYSTWSLLTASLRLSLDGVPVNVSYEQIMQTLRAHPQVFDVHHVHIWAISTTQNALTAHIVLKDFSQYESVKTDLKHELLHLQIEHVTLEFEATNEPCQDESIVL